MVTTPDVEQLLQRWWIDAPGTTLRDEDRKKAFEVAALLNALGKVNREHPLVDVAAGKAYVGLLAAELLGFTNLTVIERDERRIADCRRVAEKLTQAPKSLSLHAADVGDGSAWPAERPVVVGLHACGPASDAVIDLAVAKQARWLFLVPCCYSAKLATWSRAHDVAERLGVPDDAPVRGRFVESLIDAERALRLEAGGFEVEVLAFVAPTVTPHNRLFRARFTRSATRMASARARLARLFV